MTTILPPSVGDPLSNAENSYAQAVLASEALERQIQQDPQAFRVLTGDRPTGPLHLGHYVGTLANRVRLQQLGVSMSLVVADYQVITDRDGVGPLRRRVRELVADYLAAGIDPDTAMIFPHSAVPALNQLMLPFLSLVTEAELHRNPTVKAELAATTGRPMSALLLTYPVHQAADILFCHSNVVPVGRDQLPHLEMTRTIARRFNERYGAVFPVPEALLSKTPLLLGTDGQKMAKSRGNTIDLGFTDDQTAAVLRKAVTDNIFEITYDPIERPEVANLILMATSLTGEAPEAFAQAVGTGAGRLKEAVTGVINERLGPLRRRRRELVADPGYLDAVIASGTALAMAVASDTLAQVRSVMQMDYLGGV